MIQLNSKHSANSTIGNQVQPHVLTGPLNNENVGTFAWSNNRLLAFACANRIMIVETSDRLRLCQNLDKHQSYVNRLRWNPEACSLRLLSADAKSNMIVWDINSGSFLTLITGTSKEERRLLDVQWFWFHRSIRM